MTSTEQTRVQPRHASFSATRTYGWAWLVAPSLLAIALCLLFLLYLYSRPLAQQLDFGTDELVLKGVYTREKNEDLSFVYSTGSTPFEFPRAGHGTYALHLRMGGPGGRVPLPTLVRTLDNVTHLGAVRQIRGYHLLVPSEPGGSVRMTVDSTTTKLPTDRRQLGLLLDRLQLVALDVRIPPPSLIVVPIALLLTWAGLLGLTIPRAAKLLLLLFAALLLALVFVLGRGRAPIHGLTMLAAGAFAAVSLLRGVTVTAPPWWLRVAKARWIWVPALLFAVTRLGIALVAYFAEPLLGEPVFAPDQPPRSSVPLLDALGTRFDSNFYLAIAEHGYGFRSNAVAFFPLLPLLIRGLTLLTHDSLIAGLLVSNFVLLGATILLYRLVALEGDEDLAARSVWYLLIFPTSFVGSTIYTESLMLFAAIGSLYAARRGRWFAAGILGMFAALSRFVGLVVAPMLLIEWWMQRHDLSRRTPSIRGLVAPCLVPLGTAAYMLYLQWSFGEPLAFLRASQEWDRRPTSPLAFFPELFVRPSGGWGEDLLAGRLPLNNYIDFGAAAGFIGLGLLLLRQRRWSEGAYVLLGALVPLSSGVLPSQRRYVWVLFPAFILLARWGRHAWFDRALATLFLLGLGLFTAMYVNWYWVG